MCVYTYISPQMQKTWDEVVQKKFFFKKLTYICHFCFLSSIMSILKLTSHGILHYFRSTVLSKSFSRLTMPSFLNIFSIIFQQNIIQLPLFILAGTWELVNPFVGTKNFRYHICYENIGREHEIGTDKRQMQAEHGK